MENRRRNKGRIFLFLGYVLLILNLLLKARSSGGERFLDTEEVGGSIPPVPTIERQTKNLEIRSEK